MVEEDALLVMAVASYRGFMVDNGVTMQSSKRSWAVWLGWASATMLPGLMNLMRTGRRTQTPSCFGHPLTMVDDFMAIYGPVPHLWYKIYVFLSEIMAGTKN